VKHSDQRKSGGSTLVLVVALFERMKRDDKASKAKKGFEKWFEDKSAMQKGLANHTLALDIDGKGVCNEAIEELLLAASATTMVTAAGGCSGARRAGVSPRGGSIGVGWRW
jgi:hypothetical protein